MSFMRRILAVAIAAVLMAAVVSAQDRPRTQSAAVPGTGDALDGAKLFVTTCGFCHQDGGRVAGRGPKLAGTDRADDYLLNRIRVGKEGAMPAYGRAFTETQLRALVAYIRSLKADAQ
jgi:mono/diheme cytochrome c family protein